MCVAINERKIIHLASCLRLDYFLCRVELIFIPICFKMCCGCGCCFCCVSILYSLVFSIFLSIIFLVLFLASSTFELLFFCFPCYFLFICVRLLPIFPSWERQQWQHKQLQQQIKFQISKKEWNSIKWRTWFVLPKFNHKCVFIQFERFDVMLLLLFFSIFEFSESKELTANWSMNIWTQWTITTFQTRSNHYKCLKILIQPPWAQMFRLVYSIFVIWKCRLNGKESILAMPGRQQHIQILVGYFCLAQQHTQGTKFSPHEKSTKKNNFQDRIWLQWTEQENKKRSTESTLNWNWRVNTHSFRICRLFSCLPFVFLYASFPHWWQWL